MWQKLWQKTGVGFGVASGVITTMGLMVGLYATTFAKSYVLGGVLMIAIADAFSDSVGMHFSKESEGCTTKEIWSATLLTFVSKFCVATSFVLAIIFLPLKIAVAFNIFWGLFLTGSFSFVMAKHRKNSPWKAILEHYLIIAVVVFLTYCLGRFVSHYL